MHDEDSRHQYDLCDDPALHELLITNQFSFLVCDILAGCKLSAAQFPSSPIRANRFRVSSVEEDPLIENSKLVFVQALEILI
jgi:hypothetical protein